MILPFYDRIGQQEYRQFLDRNDILLQIKYYCLSNSIPEFQWSFNSLYNSYGADIVYIDSYGIEIERVAIPSGYFTRKKVNGKDLLINYTNALGFEHLHCRYYIYIYDSSVGRNDSGYYSEVVTVENNIKPIGRLQLNNRAFYRLNTYGYILLSDYEGGYYNDSFLRIKASSTKNYTNFDLSNFELNFYLKSIITLENVYNVDVIKEYSGLKTYLQRTTQSTYILKFLAVKTIADNCDRLRFFDNVEITDMFGKVYIPTDILEISHERIETSGIYEVTITFKTTYDIDVQITNNIQTDMTSADVGMVVHIPAVLSLENVLAAKNAYLVGTGFRYVDCDGSQLTPDEHPILKNVIGTKNVGGSDKIVLPDMKGKILISAGQYTDKNSKLRTIASAEIDPDGEYEHKMSRTEMSHFHVVGGMNPDYRRIVHFINDELSTPRTLTGMTDYNGDSIKSDLPDNEEDVLVSGLTHIYVSTLNDNDPAVLAARSSHNNCQPAMGAYALMFIDDINY